jgi:hypothetical protein
MFYADTTLKFYRLNYSNFLLKILPGLLQEFSRQLVSG